MAEKNAYKTNDTNLGFGGYFFLWDGRFAICGERFLDHLIVFFRIVLNCRLKIVSNLNF